jgi:hypothetical protein
MNKHGAAHYCPTMSPSRHYPWFNQAVAAMPRHVFSKGHLRPSLVTVGVSMTSAATKTAKLPQK